MYRIGIGTCTYVLISIYKKYWIKNGFRLASETRTELSGWTKTGIVESSTLHSAHTY